ncbi:MAG: PQQ-binding-like beta-propeller repeat protein, partial [Thermoplasmata archaeon]|nr:PQQ-binding-like beta-propeller repeat protein [Thermoplasmata archaeon]
SDGSISISEIIWKFDTPDKVWSSPAVVGNRVYVGCGKGDDLNNKLYCLYANNGTINWTYPAVGNIKDVVSSPAVVNGKVYFGSMDNKVYSLWASNGTRIWDYTTGDNIISSPAVAYGRVFIGSDDNKLYCLDANTGTKIWDFTTGNEIWASPSVADDKVYVSSCDGKVYCLNATTNTAQLIWEYKITSKQYGICSSPTIVEGKVIIGGATGGAGAVSKIYCFMDIDLIPPTITKTNPEDQSTDIPTTVQLAINFSEPMDQSTITTSNILLKDGSATPVIGTVNYLAGTASATFTPDSVLKRGETYTATVLSAVKDLATFGLDGNKNGLSEGSPLDDYSWQFTTSQNIPPGLTDANLTPVDGDLTTLLEYRITYTDLDNDTPKLIPAFINVHIDGELTGRPLILDSGAPANLRDDNYTNGERYIYSTQLTSYGVHSYQFKCSDSIDEVFTTVFDGPLVWDPQDFTVIPTQTATEDIDLILDLSDYIYDEDTSMSKLVISENSSYANLDDFNITFNYPNSFNYPSGRNFELVQISVFDPTRDYNVSQEVRVDVVAVNDPPVISGVPDLHVHEDRSFAINVTMFISDEDNLLTDLEISTDSSYATVDTKKITFLYPINSGKTIDFVKVMVFDGELYGYQNITVTVIPEGTPFILSTIPDQSAIEDVELVVDLTEYIMPLGTNEINDFVLEISSKYGKISTTTLIFNYPNGFNYPSGRDFEIVQMNVSHEGYQDSQSFKIGVEAVNDEPYLTVLNAPTTAVENITVKFSVEYFDMDGSENPFVEVIIGRIGYLMMPISGDIHDLGATYELARKFPVGEYDYYFSGDDRENATNSVFQSGNYILTVIEDSESTEDSDSDGIPDIWELKYGLDPNDPSDAAQDPDGDNYTNLEEYLGIDGKPGGDDSSSPYNPLDVPIGVQDDDNGETDENAILIWVALAIIIVIIVVILIVVLMLHRKKKQLGEMEPEEPYPPYHHEPQPPIAPQEQPPPSMAQPVKKVAQGQSWDADKPERQIEWDDEQAF